MSTETERLLYDYATRPPCLPDADKTAGDRFDIEPAKRLEIYAMLQELRQVESGQTTSSCRTW